MEIINSNFALMAISLITVFLFGPAAAQGQSPPVDKGIRFPRWVDFYQEKVTIVCHDREVEIEGIYFFRNLTDGAISMIIQYPFPVDGNHPFPHEINVEGYPFRKDSASIYVNISLIPREEKVIKFAYKQFHKNKSAIYILSSTQHWGHPIKKADFVISVPQSWNTNISLKPDEKHINEGRLLFYISKQNFLPNQDLVITW